MQCITLVVASRQDKNALHCIADGLTNHHHHTARGDLMAKTANLALRISPDVKAALEVAAREDVRSVSNYVELLLISNLEARGLLIRDKEPA